MKINQYMSHQINNFYFCHIFNHYFFEVNCSPVCFSKLKYHEDFSFNFQSLITILFLQTFCLTWYQSWLSIVFDCACMHSCVYTDMCVSMHVSAYNTCKDLK